MIEEDDAKGLEDIKPNGRPRKYLAPKLMTDWVEKAFIERINKQAVKEGQSRAVLIQAIMTRYIMDQEMLEEMRRSNPSLELPVNDEISFTHEKGVTKLKVNDKEYPLETVLLKKLYLLSKR